MTDQPDLFTYGEQLRDAGIAQVLGNTPEEWKAAAMNAIEVMADAGRTFTAEDVRGEVGDPPGHFNAMGAVFRTAAKRGLIRKVGFVRAKRPGLHATELALWSRPPDA